jgi:hypothetical protein
MLVCARKVSVTGHQHAVCLSFSLFSSKCRDSSQVPSCYYVLLMQSSRFEFNKIKPLARRPPNYFPLLQITQFGINSDMFSVLTIKCSAPHFVFCLPFSRSTPEMYGGYVLITSCIRSSVTLSYTTRIHTKDFPS